MREIKPLCFPEKRWNCTVLYFCEHKRTKPKGVIPFPWASQATLNSLFNSAQYKVCVSDLAKETGPSTRWLTRCSCASPTHLKPSRVQVSKVNLLQIVGPISPPIDEIRRDTWSFSLIISIIGKNWTEPILAEHSLITISAQNVRKGADCS